MREGNLREKWTKDIHSPVTEGKSTNVQVAKEKSNPTGKKEMPTKAISKVQIDLHLLIDKKEKEGLIMPITGGV